MYEIFIRELTMPLAVEGVSVTNSDGTFSVYVNSCLSREKQIEAANHEIAHIKLEHFLDFEPVICNELQAVQSEKCVPNIVPDYNTIILL